MFKFIRSSTDPYCTATVALVAVALLVSSLVLFAGGLPGAYLAAVALSSAACVACSRFTWTNISNEHPRALACIREWRVKPRRIPTVLALSSAALLGAADLTTYRGWKFGTTVDAAVTQLQVPEKTLPV